jgi:hypothetical protein
MTDRIVDISLRKAALVAGFGYLIIFVFNTFALLTLNNLIVRGDAATTASNIMASESLFRLGIASWIAVLAVDAVVAWALYVFLKPVSPSLSLITAWFRLLFVAIAGSAFITLFSVLPLLSGADDFAVFQPDQLNAVAMLFLNPYDHGFNVAFVFFGVHILGLGYLILKSDYIPRILGILLIIAFMGYLIDSFASVLSSDYADNDALFLLFVAVPALIAEYSLTFWLLIRGRKVEQREKRAPDSA